VRSPKSIMTPAFHTLRFGTGTTYEIAWARQTRFPFVMGIQLFDDDTEASSIDCFKTNYFEPGIGGIRQALGSFCLNSYSSAPPDEFERDRFCASSRFLRGLEKRHGLAVTRSHIVPKLCSAPSGHIRPIQPIVPIRPIRPIGPIIAKTDSHSQNSYHHIKYLQSPDLPVVQKPSNLDQRVRWCQNSVRRHRVISDLSRPLQPIQRFRPF
jgi:hypothetical protein